MCSIPHARLERPGGSGRSYTIRSGHHAVWIRGPWIELASPAPPQRREERRGTAQEGRQSAPLSSRVRFRLLALLLPAALVWPSTAATDTDSSQEQVERPSPPLPPSPSSLEAGSSAPPWAWVWPTVALALLALVLSAALCWMHTQMRGMRMAFVPSDPVQHHAGSAVFAQVPPPSLPPPVVAEASGLDECALLATPTGVAPGEAPSTPDLAPAVAAEGVTAHHSSSSQPIHLPGGEHGLEQLSPCKRVI